MHNCNELQQPTYSPGGGTYSPEIGKEPGITDCLAKATESSQMAKDKLKYICNRIGVYSDELVQSSQPHDSQDIKSLTRKLMISSEELNDLLDRLERQL